MKTISIRQPWASAIAEGFKDIENRDWMTSHRGPLLIHASKQPDPEGVDFITRILGKETAAVLWATPQPTGGIVGIADLVEIVIHSKSPWFQGRYGWIFKNARPLPFTPCRGQLYLFEGPDLDEVQHTLPL